MYAAKAAAGGGPPGQVQGQQGVPASGQGTACGDDRNLPDLLLPIIAFNVERMPSLLRLEWRLYIWDNE